MMCVFVSRDMLVRMVVSMAVVVMIGIVIVMRMLNARRNGDTSDGGCGSSSLPNSSIIAAPNSGNSGISQIWSRKFMPSPLE